MTPFKRTKIWMMFSNHIHVWLGQGKLSYWQFILDRVLVHYQNVPCSQDFKDKEKMVILMVDGYPGGQGGLTDRLRGALSVYSLCKKHNWIFKIHFVYPFDLHEYLIPNSYNWTIEPNQVSRNIPYSKPIALYLMNLLFEKWLDSYLLQREIADSKHAQYHIYTSAFFNKQHYPQLFKELFKPSALLHHELDMNRKNIGMKYVSATFRFQELLGDLKEAEECQVLSSVEQQSLLNKCINKLQKFISQTPDDYKVLVTADSSRFLSEAQKLERVYVIPGKIYHPHYAAEGKNPFLKSFIDFYMLMEAERVHLFKTGPMYKSGFPEFAALLGNKPFIYAEC